MKRILPLAVALATGLQAAASEPPARAASFADFDRRARAGEELSVVFFGGSLTWSANASDPNRTGFRPLVAEHLRAKYPSARFRFHDAGLGGTGSTLGVFRLDRDVLAYGPDLVFLDFACNDGGGPEALAQSCCYESILRRLVGRGVPVVQMFFTFGFWARNLDAPENGHAQLAAYRRYIRDNPKNWTRDRFGAVTQYSLGNLELLNGPRIAFVASHGFWASELKPKMVWRRTEVRRSDRL